MKEPLIKKITNYSFKEILNNSLVTKAQTGISDLVTGVKNFFRHTSSDTEKVANEINNYLKTPAEIEAELQLMASSNHDYTLIPQGFDHSQQVEKSDLSGKIKSIEEALAGEMEENY